MSARIANVRPKPGFLMDAAGDIVPTRQNVVPFMRDSLTNLLTGQGTSIDRRTAGFYAFVPVTPDQAEAGYRGSWLQRKIIDIPAKDMTRNWRDWQTSKDKIEKLEAEERRLQIKAKCRRALILSRLYGGGGIVLGTDDRNLMEPLNVARVRLGGLRYAHVMSRHELVEGAKRTDPTDPWYGEPEYFQISAPGRAPVQLHPSRVVTFIGQRAPEGSHLQGMSWYWGDPIMQSIGDAVKHADLAQAGFAALIDEAKLDIFKFKDLMSLIATDAGMATLNRRLSATQSGKSTWRSVAIDAEDEWEQRQVSWAGIPETLLTFLQVVAGAADIPVTRLLGQSPKGLQSTGDGEERDYHSKVKADQDELLAPRLDRIDELLIPSALGSRPSDVYFEFAPLTEPTEKEKAEIAAKDAETVKKMADTGHLPDAVLTEIAANKMIESGYWPGCEASFEKHRAEMENPEPEPDPAELGLVATDPPEEQVTPPQPNPKKARVRQPVA